MKKVSYEEYEEAFLEKTRLNLKLIRYEMIYLFKILIFFKKIFIYCIKVTFI